MANQVRVLGSQAAYADFMRQQMCNKINSALRAADFAPLDEMIAEWIHVLAFCADLNPTENQHLAQLLDYAPALAEFNRADYLALYIAPRLGTRSPWSSKAFDILSRAGLDKITHIERLTAIYLPLKNLPAKPLQSKQLSIIQELIIDKMTQSCLYAVDDFAQIFAEQAPAPLAYIELGDKPQAAFEAANQNLGLALSHDEIEYLIANYQQLGRNPSDVELMMFAQANSEHCRHKIFNADWIIDGKTMPKSLFAMIKNSHQHSPEDTLVAYSDNSSVIRGHHVERFFYAGASQHYAWQNVEQHILMKVETHNHPTAIAPHAGAATGSGGEIRDEGATGRGSKPKAGLCAYNVSNLNIGSLRQPWEQDWGRPAHLASALQIMLEAPIGAAQYNNEFGRPNLCGYFRSLEQEIDGEYIGYHKPIMLAGGMGSIDSRHLKKHALQGAANIIVLGGAAMQIGLGGGAASSLDSGAQASNLDFASVQRPNAEMERRCQEVIDRCCALGADNPILSIHDVGAGGLSNALPELINDGGVGGKFELRDILSDETGMAPLAIWCNESQERYVLAIEKANMDIFTQIATRERCPFSVVGSTQRQAQLEVFDRHFQNKPVDMPLEVLLGKPPKMLREVSRHQRQLQAATLDNMDLNDAIGRVLNLPSVASKSFLITIGDRSITGLVSREQMVGRYQVPIADCAVTLAAHRGFQGEAMAVGERSPVAIIDAAASARMAVGEAILNILAAPIAKLGDIKLSANWMAACNVQGEDAALYDAVHAVGMELCPALGIGIPVGKDSLSMKTVWDGKSQHSPLSVIISAFAPVADVRQTLTPELAPVVGSQLWLIDLGGGKMRMGASALLQVFNQTGDCAPDLDNPQLLIHFFNAINELREKNLIQSYHDRSCGGVFTSLVEMSFCNRTGMDIHLVADKPALAQLFNEELGAVIQIDAAKQNQVHAILAKHDLNHAAVHIGTLNNTRNIVIHQGDKTIITKEISSLQQQWHATSHAIAALRDNALCADSERDLIDDPNHRGIVTSLQFAHVDNAPFLRQFKTQPKMAILREQGINGHIEMAAAFASVGFDCVDVHLSDLETKRQSLDDFQGLVVCGGFSYGDVLGAGGGFAKNILFNPLLADQFAAFFANQHKFALGVCNGCQVLSQLKALIPGAAHWPRFVDNLSAQFEARTLCVQIQPSASVLLAEMAHSVLPIAVAHGEGRVDYSKTGDSSKASVCLNYVDSALNPTERYPLNPNGSANGATGFCNDDGRITIMMPHPERVIRKCQHSFHPEGLFYQDQAPWLKLFQNARRFVS